MFEFFMEFFGIRFRCWLLRCCWVVVGEMLEFSFVWSAGFRAWLFFLIGLVFWFDGGVLVLELGGLLWVVWTWLGGLLVWVVLFGHLDYAVCLCGLSYGF